MESHSDFVIQCGLHPEKCPVANIAENETHKHTKISNKRGTAAIAHFDVPDNGNSEFFINLGTNSHLDDAYGGYCVSRPVLRLQLPSCRGCDRARRCAVVFQVFAVVKDEASFTVVDKIAAAVKAKGKVSISMIVVV